MATISPFRALHPAPATVAAVAAVPYDVVSTEEARALALNPLNFLHVSRAEIDMPVGSDPHAEGTYARALQNFNWLTRAAQFEHDDAPCAYVYRLQADGRAQSGVVGCFSLDEYGNGVIKRHEETRRDKEDDRTRHLIALGAQTGPVLLVHRPSSRLGDLVDETMKTNTMFDFVAPDGVAHATWRVPPGRLPDVVSAFRDIPTLYIADGHHRAASAARARQTLGEERAGSRAADTFLAVAFPADQMRVLAYNRVVRDLNGHTTDAWLTALRERFQVETGPATPARKGDVSMFVDGAWHTIRFDAGRDHEAGGVDLDVTRLQERILSPLLGIGDVRSDTRIEPIGGARSTAALEALVASGRYAVAFSLCPVTVDDMMQTCDLGRMMPPKSTWFEPKLRDGLFIHTL